MKRFENQTVVVTGGTRGIGRGISEAFFERGGRVIATYAGNEEAALAFKASLAEMGERLELRKFDVSRREEVEAFWSWLDDNDKTVEVLINNAGIRCDNLTASMSEEEWDRVMDINLKGTLLMSQKAVLNMMKGRYGRIINMSSIGAQLGLPGQANYAASKAGQIALSKVLSKEVAKRGITVNNILPGFIETELIGDLPEEQVKLYKSQVPMKRFGKTEEVAAAVLFLAGRDAGYITGACLEISGGAVMGTPTKEVLECLPQKPPFLFVDEVVDIQDNRVITRYHVTGEEEFFKGHFPGNPIMPGVILQEAAFQSGALLMKSRGSEGLGVVARVQDVRFKNFVRPGDILEMEVSLDESISNAFYMSGKTRVNGKVIMNIKFTGMGV